MLGVHDSGFNSGLFGEVTENTKTITAAFIKNKSTFDHLAIISGVMKEKETLLGSKYTGAVGINGANPKSYFKAVFGVSPVKKSVPATSVSHPSEIEPKTKKISVSVKHLTEDPYSKIINKYESN